MYTKWLTYLLNIRWLYVNYRNYYLVNHKINPWQFNDKPHGDYKNDYTGIVV